MQLSLNEWVCRHNSNRSKIKIISGGRCEVNKNKRYRGLGADASVAVPAVSIKSHLFFFIKSVVFSIISKRYPMKPGKNESSHVVGTLRQQSIFPMLTLTSLGGNTPNQLNTDCLMTVSSATVHQ